MRHQFMAVVSGNGRALSLFGDSGLAAGYAEVDVSQLGLRCPECKGSKRVRIHGYDYFYRGHKPCAYCYATGVRQTLPPCSCMTIEAEEHAVL